MQNGTAVLEKPVGAQLEITGGRRFTPGPWKVYDNGFFYDIKVPWLGRSVVEDHSPSLCQVFYEGCDGVTGRPNAQLIAAAPTLFDVLENIARAAVDHKSTDEPEQFRAWVFSQAQQALSVVSEQEMLVAPGARPYPHDDPFVNEADAVLRPGGG